MTLKPDTQTQSRTLRLSACYHHPAKPVSGFCASCLRERLSGHLESSTSTAFVHSLKNIGDGAGSRAIATSLRTRRAAPSYFSPELRRCKSVSVEKCEASSGLSEPRRMSCDVRGRSTLAGLFDLHDENNGSNEGTKVESQNLGLSRLICKVGELTEEDGNGGKIRVSEDVLVPDVNVEEELKTMKEYIEIELQSTRHNVRDIAGSFWVAASVFSKKLRKWRRKQRVKNRSSDNGGCIAAAGDGGSLTMRVEKLKGRKLRDTQSEVGDYGVGRRSCDTEPRLSVDAGRISVDDPRFSFDEHRASWDGYLIARTIPRLTPMLSVVENVMLGQVNRAENHLISVDGQIHSINEDETTFGGSTRTNSDCSSSKRRSSFDRSSSVRSSNRKAMGLEVDDVKSVSNVKVSPVTVDIFHGTKLVITEKELKDWNLNSLRDGHSDDFESVTKDDVNAVDVYDSNEFRKSSKWQKVYNILSFKQRLKEKKHEIFTDVIDHPVADKSKVWRVMDY